MPENDPDGYERSPLDDALQVPGPAVREATGQEYWRAAARPLASAVGLGPLAEPTPQQIASRVDLNKARSLGLDPASTDKIFMDRRAKAAEAKRVLEEKKAREEANKRLMGEKAAINRAQKAGKITAQEAAEARSQLEQSAQPEQSEFAGALANRTPFDEQPGQAQFASLSQPQAATPARPQLAGYRGFGDLERQSQQAQAGFQGALEETGTKLDQAGDLRREAAAKAARADLERVDAVKDLYAERDAAIADFEADQRESDAFHQEAIAVSRESVAAARKQAREHPAAKDRRGIGAKISAAIAMALGAFGASINGGPNVAMQIINDAIGRDLDEQREELAQKKGVLAGALNELGERTREYGDSKKAELIYRDQMLERGKARLEEIQSTVGMDQQTEARLLDMHAQITEQQAQGELELEKHHVQAANQAIGDRGKFRQAGNQIAGMRNRDATAMMSAEAKAIGGSRKTAVPGTRPTGEVELTPQQAGKLRDKRAEAGKVLGLLGELRQGINNDGYEFFRTMGAVRQKTIATMLQTQLKNVAGLGVMSDSDRELLQSIVSDDPSKVFRQDTVKAQIDALDRVVSDGWKVEASSHGLIEQQFGEVTGEGL